MPVRGIGWWYCFHGGVSQAGLIFDSSISGICRDGSAVFYNPDQIEHRFQGILQSGYFFSGLLCYHYGNLAINRYEFKIIRHGDSFFSTHMF
jgi:hypothetical protein